MESALTCLALLARLYGEAINPEALREDFDLAASDQDPTEVILLAARRMGFRASSERLPGADAIVAEVLPALAPDRQGEYFVLARASGAGEARSYLVQRANAGSPEVLDGQALERIWGGELILVRPRGGGAAAVRRFNLAWFVPTLRKYRSVFAEVLLASFVLQLISLVTPLFFQVVMDKVLAHSGFNTLNVLAFGVLVVLAFEALITGMRNYLFSHTANRVDAELSARLFSHLVQLPLAYFERRQTGHTVARVQELESIRNFITGTALTLVIDLSFFFVFLAVLWHYSPKLTLLVLLSLPVYLLLSLLVTPLLRARLDEKFKAGAESQAFITEAVAGMSALKSLALERRSTSRWERLQSRYVSSAFRAGELGNVATQIAGLTSKLTTVAIIWWGVHLVIAGAMTVGQLVAFNMIAGRLTAPILKLVQLWQDFQQAGISMRRLGDILNAPLEDTGGRKRMAPPATKGELCFQSVRFRYSQSKTPVLQGLSLHAAPGEVIGVVGPSGAGKSTIARLLQGLHYPEAGKLSLDGVDLSLLDRAWLRRRVGVVQQESRLFTATVRENIAIADPAAPLSRVVGCARLAGAHEFIMALEHGYDTQLVENGASLSGGQRQRIAIARALLPDPRVLVFDEATSALDFESERALQENMAAIRQGRTVIVIAHRVTAVRSCDRILVLDQGRVTESGSHAELLALGGYYARLLRYQSSMPLVRQLPGSGGSAGPSRRAGGEHG